MTHSNIFQRMAPALAAAALLAGCASAPGTVQQSDPRDPFESYNRSVTRFNDKVDEALLKPVASAYRDITPKPIRTGVGNFFGNLGDAWSFVNSVLQLRGRAALDNLVRFNVNTVFGLAGVLDIATEMGIDRHRQDFGLTLARWGVPSGPYFVLPLLGPSTVRDAAVFPIDWYGDAVRQFDPVGTRYGLYGLRIVDKRASLLGATNVLGGAALDSYSFTRDVYLGLRSGREGAGSGEYDQDDGKLPQDY